MKSQSLMFRLFTAVVAFLAMANALAAPAKKPLKIFILAGQSNMEGHAKASTFDAMAMDPLTAPLLKEMRSPRAADKVWISYLFEMTLRIRASSRTESWRSVLAPRTSRQKLVRSSRLG